MSSQNPLAGLDSKKEIDKINAFIAKIEETFLSSYSLLHQIITEEAQDLKQKKIEELNILLRQLINPKGVCELYPHFLESYNILDRITLIAEENGCNNIFSSEYMETLKFESLIFPFSLVIRLPNVSNEPLFLQEMYYCFRESAIDIATISFCEHLLASAADVIVISLGSYGNVQQQCPNFAVSLAKQQRVDILNLDDNFSVMNPRAYGVTFFGNSFNPDLSNKNLYVYCDGGILSYRIGNHEQSNTSIRHELGKNINNIREYYRSTKHNLGINIKKILEYLLRKTNKKIILFNNTSPSLPELFIQLGQMFTDKLGKQLEILGTTGCMSLPVIIHSPELFQNKSREQIFDDIRFIWEEMGVAKYSAGEWGNYCFKGHDYDNQNMEQFVQLFRKKGLGELFRSLDHLAGNHFFHAESIDKVIPPLIFSNNELRSPEGLFDNLGQGKQAKEADEQTKSVILEHLAKTGYELGKAIGKGDCFFDAVGQGLLEKNIAIPMEYQGQFVYKKLRQLCEKYAKNNREVNGHWLKMQLAKANNEYENYIMTIGYTAPEVEVMWKAKQLPSEVACWGEPHRDGRIICQELKIKLHVIELLVVENHVMLSHHLIDGNGSKPLVSDEEISKTYNDNKVVHLAGYQNTCHWVPVLVRTTKDKKPESLPLFVSSNNNRKDETKERKEGVTPSATSLKSGQ
jgi:hypothetical protein